ncbi:hypothetical protein GW17_00002540 [Ensete ventricosum]|nr:hypothetical protein GW17_00002540 [Ensete ventricosum]
MDNFSATRHSSVLRTSIIVTLLRKSFHQLYLLRAAVSKLHHLGGERRSGGRRRRGEQAGGPCALAHPRSSRCGVEARSDGWNLGVQLGKLVAGMVELGSTADSCKKVVGSGAYPTEQELGNLNSAGVDSTEQELGNLGFCRGGGLGRESWDLLERVNSGTNPGDLAERVNSSTNPGDLTERVNSGTNPRDLAERVNSGTNPTDLAKRVNSGTNHGDLAERVNSGTNPGDLAERVDSGALALIL